jgi:hypothetical protein
MIADEIGVIGMNETRHRRADQPLRVALADERRKLFVREHDAVAVDRYCFVQAAEQAAERAFAFANQHFLDGHLLQQLVRAVRKSCRRSLHSQPLGEATAAHNAIQLIDGAGQS